MAEFEGLVDDESMLVILDTITKQFKDQLDPKNPHGLRSRVDERRRKLYELTGSKSSEIRLDGEKVGTYAIRLSKPTESQTGKRFEVENYEELAKFVMNACQDYVMQYVASDLASFAAWYLDATGEMPEGCALKHYVTPEVEPRYLGGTLKVDAQKVADIVGANEHLNETFGAILGVSTRMLGSGRGQQ